MHALYSRVLLFAWGIWIGGLLGLLVAVSTIFRTLDPDRHAAGNIAAPVFGATERPMLVVAAMALLSCLGLVVAKRTFSRSATLLLIALAALIGVVEVAAISPRIDAMRLNKETDTPAFRSLHGASMGLYAVMVGTLGGAGMFLPRAIRQEP